MKKKFNTTGNCDENRHYLMDNSKKLEAIMELIEFGEYFTINRPRQYGKTTTLFLIKKALEKKEEYLTIKLNFQGRDSNHLASDDAFAEMFINDLEEHFIFENQEIAEYITTEKVRFKGMDNLSKFITRLMYKLDKKVVLLIDEVDASSNYDAFLVFLGMLRTKFLGRGEPKHRTFHSVVLAGVHDIKNLKFKLRNPNDAQYNSPWNIAIDFEVRMEFIPKEIEPMLKQYSAAEGVTMDISAIAERLYYHTAGYPFLVSKLCKNIAEKILPKRENKTVWTLEDVEESVQLLLMENNTNFDSLIKNLENHQDLYDVVYRIVIDGEAIGFNPHNAVISKGILYGIFKRNGTIRIHNKIYEQLIYNYMASNVEIKLKTENYNSFSQFQLTNNALDVQKIVLKFQAFLKEEFTEKDQAFLERQWRLIFLAFLRPILNGSGYTFKEIQISEERRLDVVITYFQHQYIIELKRWYGQSSHEKGIIQLHDYLQKQDKDKGYLVIFEHKTAKTWRIEEVKYKGKEIFAVWV